MIYYRAMKPKTGKFAALRPSLASVFAAVLLGGCTTPPAPETSDGTPWTTDRLQREFVGDDPWEPFNRAMFAVDDGVMTYAADPLASLYCSIVPRPVVRGVDNAVHNSEYSVRLGACLLRAEWGGSWDETKRFLVNTTVGLGGLFDLAENWFGIHSTDASLSGTLAAWGLARGPAFAFPFIPRANVRDASGYVLDQGLDPKTWVGILLPTGIWIPWTASLWPNYAAVWTDPWDSSISPRADPYAAYMRLMTAKSLLDEDLSRYHYLNARDAGTAETRRPPVRAVEARPAGLRGRWRDIPGYAPRTPALDTLRQRLFRPVRDNDFWWMPQSVFNSDFASMVQERTANVDSNLPRAPYGFVPAPDGEPGRPHRLVFVIPGIGGTRSSRATLAMGELLHDAGAAVVLCDDPFHWECMRSVNHGILPGNLPEDAHRFADFMDLVYSDLVTSGLTDDYEISAVGWSMGGLVVSHLAALQTRGQLGLVRGPLLAVNPPVSFGPVADALESFLAPSKAWTRDQAKDHFVETARRLAVWDRAHDEPTPDVSEEDAQYTVGVALGSTLPELVALATGTNQPVSVRDYLLRHVAAAYPGTDPDDLARRAGLGGIARELGDNANYRAIHTRDDFLLDDADRALLDRTLGDRITWFSAGAHCGMFYTPEFRAEVLDRLGLEVK